MRVLLACEFSGVTRSTFSERGHDAWSCDLLPSEKPGQHVQGDVSKLLKESWDLVIAHPPCQYLSYAGVAHWNKPGREENREAALKFFMSCVNANAPRVCVENPVGWPNVVFRKPDQIINPFQFGHPERKKTCLWLKGLPLLSETEAVKPEEPAFRDATTGKRRYFTDRHSNKIGRAYSRSRTFQGIANAMAEQWGGQI